MERPDQPELPAALSGHDRSGVIDWKPSDVVTTMWVTLSILLGVLAFLIFGLFYSLFGARPDSPDLTINWILTAALSAGVLLLHQLIHVVVARLCGAKPRFDLDVIHWVLPVIYLRLDGQHFGRNQFLMIALTPLLIPSLVALVLMPFEERMVYLIVPLAVNAAFSIRDVWTARVVWQQPSGTLIEVQRDGLRMVRPL